MIRQIHAATREPVTLVLDNAFYHRARDVRELANSLQIELLYLPPYSPNLNLIERVWKLVKKRALSARVLPDFERFAASVTSTLETLETEHQDELTNLLTPNFQDLDDVLISPA